MKKSLLLALCLALLSITLFADVDSSYRQACLGATSQARGSLSKAEFKDKTVAVLPIRGDKSNLFANALKNTLVELGFQCVGYQDDTTWKTVIDAVAWNERKGDILDPNTLVQFGALKSAQVILYGNVRDYNTSEEKSDLLSVTLFATDLSTNQVIWSGDFAYRLYKGTAVKGFVELPFDLKELLTESMGAACDSLKDPAFVEKCASFQNVIVVPMTCDIDQYITGKAIEMLVSRDLGFTVELNRQVTSLESVRAGLKDGTISNAAIFYGDVRDLHQELVETPRENDVLQDTTLVADLQLFLEYNGKVLWSKTVTRKKQLQSTRGFNEAEREAKHQKELEEQQKQDDANRLKEKELEAKTEADRKAQKELEAQAEADRKAQKELEAQAEADRKAQKELEAKAEADRKAQKELEAKAEEEAKEAERLKLEQAKIKMEEEAPQRKLKEQQERVANAGNEIKADLLDNWKSYAATIGKWILVIVGVVILLALVKAYISHRKVR